MRVLVIGCGSIGGRRARILAEMGHEVEGYDLDGVRHYYEGGAGDVSYFADHVPGCDNLAGNIDRADAVLICTPPETHLTLARQALEAGVKGLYVEKPLALSMDGWPELVAGAEGVITMGACNLRFDERLGGLGGQGDGPWHFSTEAATWSLEMGQHAKYWNPNHQPISLILDSIHELDLLVQIAGPISKITGYSHRDSASVQVWHEYGCFGVIVLDRVSDPPHRRVRMKGSRDIDLWPPDPEMYVREMAHFVDCVERGVETCNPLPQAVETLRWALEVVEA